MEYIGTDETKLLADMRLLYYCNDGLTEENAPGSSRDLNNLKWILAHLRLPFLHLHNFLN